MTNWVFPSSFPFAYGRFFVELCWFLNFVLCWFLFCGEMGGLLQGVHWYKIWNSSQISSKSGLFPAYLAENSHCFSATPWILILNFSHMKTFSFFFFSILDFMITFNQPTWLHNGSSFIKWAIYISHHITSSLPIGIPSDWLVPQENQIKGARSISFDARNIVQTNTTSCLPIGIPSNWLIFQEKQIRLRSQTKIN